MSSQTQMIEVEELYRKHGAALVLFATAIAGEHSRAQDAVHQVFLNLLDCRKLRAVQDSKAYLFASVRNAVLNDRKVRQRNVVFENDSAWFTPPDRDYAGERNLRHAILGLPEDQRLVIVLHSWGELTFEQISDVLEISSNTAASRYRYALTKLREAMCPKENSRANS